VPSTRVLVLGASGRTGHHVVTYALAKGYDVTAHVRDPQRLTLSSAGLRVVTARIPEDGDALAAAIRSQDVVISTLGRGNSFRSENLFARAMPVLVREMESAGVRRLILMSGYGVGITYRDVPAIPRLFSRTLLRGIYADKEIGEGHVLRSNLDWTIVYPPALTNKPATGRYQVGERLTLRGVPSIARADVAEFLVSQVEDRTYSRKGVLVAPQ